MQIDSHLSLKGVLQLAGCSHQVWGLLQRRPVPNPAALTHPIESPGMRQSRRSRRVRSGQALVEYALTIALVAVGLTFALLMLRNSVGSTYNSTSQSVSEASGCGYGAACASTISDDPGNGNGDGNGGKGNGGDNGKGNNGKGNGNAGGRRP